jgi:hypothetical protein
VHRTRTCTRDSCVLRVAGCVIFGRCWCHGACRLLLLCLLLRLLLRLLLLLMHGSHMLLLLLLRQLRLLLRRAEERLAELGRRFDCVQLRLDRSTRTEDTRTRSFTMITSSSYCLPASGAGDDRSPHLASLSRLRAAPTCSLGNSNAYTESLRRHRFASWCRHSGQVFRCQ